QPLDQLVGLLQCGQRVHVRIRGVSTRMAYYTPHLRAIRGLFQPVVPRAKGYGEDYLVVHVRGTDAIAGGHPNYLPVPLSWYAQLEAHTGLRLVFVGQLGEDPYSCALRARFSDAVFAPAQRWEDDFNLLRTSTHVAIAVSTFSWLAAWLSESARRVHVPVLGLLHPHARPDVDLLPLDDERYEFHMFDLLRWGDYEPTLNRLIHEDMPARILDAAGVRRHIALPPQDVTATA